MIKVQKDLEKYLEKPGSSIVLFDGVCTLCNRSVDFLIRRNSRSNIFFLSQQSELGQQLIKDNDIDQNYLSTVIVFTRERYMTKTPAVTFLLRKLDGAWPILGYLGKLVPRFLGNPVYDYIAKNRYRWFGNRETCRIPTADERARFVA